MIQERCQRTLRESLRFSLRYSLAAASPVIATIILVNGPLGVLSLSLDCKATKFRASMGDQ
ncbi:hypothetical protein [Geobacter sp. DSM 9736]|uniref:hypothetical protein n=1 Tax=Geobacter sp. DSM 9736 TaxID=1277350 RepID=UPI000B510902|nr:hypothetical protein [Geobacter sp. DSM 9736]SNB46657.1 hypothetical protein SAMN06269301_2125 [Geobacter sp. DSM 9736]